MDSYKSESLTVYHYSNSQTFNKTPRSTSHKKSWSRDNWGSGENRKPSNSGKFSHQESSSHKRMYLLELFLVAINLVKPKRNKGASFKDSLLLLILLESRLSLPIFPKTLYSLFNNFLYTIKLSSLGFSVDFGIYASRPTICTHQFKSKLFFQFRLIINPGI